MRTLMLSIWLLILMAPACTEKGSESLVATTTVTAPRGEVAMSDPADVTFDDGTALPKPRQPRPIREAMVIQNCLRVRDAAEAWAAEAGGDYAGDPESRNASGHTLVDFLPGGTYLVNPFDGARDQPIYYAYGSAGETEYLSFDGGGCGYCGEPCGPSGYMITGFGESGEIFRITRNWPDSLAALDSLTVANCLLVRRAAERFAAENYREYPRDLADESPLGHTLIDLLPCGILLRNPYHCQYTEPRDAQAAYPGETGYTVMIQDRIAAGYAITGYGRRGIIIEFVKDPDAYKPVAPSKPHPSAM